VSLSSETPRRGRLIVLEGLDGAGTTTQVERLAAVLKAEGHCVLTTREPSDGPVGVLIRQALTGRVVLPGGAGPLAPETLALLYAADRTDHLRARVLPALEAGHVVLSDRSVLSSLAYQGASLPMEWVESINTHALPADLTLFVAVSLDVAARRRAARGGPEELFDAEEKQRRISRQYEAALTLRGAREHVVRIDGDASVEAVTEECMRHVRGLFIQREALPGDEQAAQQTTQADVPDYSLWHIPREAWHGRVPKALDATALKPLRPEDIAPMSPETEERFHRFGGDVDWRKTDD
jgi:dTMP kinase